MWFLGKKRPEKDIIAKIAEARSRLYGEDITELATAVWERAEGLKKAYSDVIGKINSERDVIVDMALEFKADEAERNEVAIDINANRDVIYVGDLKIYVKNDDLSLIRRGGNSEFVESFRKLGAAAIALYPGCGGRKIRDKYKYSEEMKFTLFEMSQNVNLDQYRSRDIHGVKFAECVFANFSPDKTLGLAVATGESPLRLRAEIRSANDDIMHDTEIVEEIGRTWEAWKEDMVKFYDRRAAEIRRELTSVRRRGA